MNISIVTVEKKEVNEVCDKWEIKDGFLLMYVGEKICGLGISQIRMFEADGPSCAVVDKKKKVA